MIDRPASAGAVLARALNVPDDNLVLRDILQTKLLAAVFSRSLKRHELVLKGGMALRTVLGSHRYTKDIDFDSNPTSSPDHVRKLMRSAIKSVIESHLIEDAVVTEPKQTDTVLRWKINGRAPDGHSAIHLTVEVSRRGSMPQGHLETATYTPPAEYGSQPILVDRYDVTALAATKTTALLSPNRTAPRDIYDLHLLIEARIEPPVDLLASRGEEALAQDLQELWSKLDLMDWHSFETEVLPYLDRQTQLGMDRGTYETMRLRVGETLEQWLRAAGEQAKRNKP